MTNLSSSATNPHEEWWEKIKQASNTKEPEIKGEENKNIGENADQRVFTRWIILICIVLFLLAFVPRIYFIFFVGNSDNPGAGWFGDAYHHWQIAYLTKEIGLSHGFLRLWDLKGMEFFWGALHPILTMLGFLITGNISIGVERAVTALFGSISVVLIFLVVRRFWNTQAAIAAALFAALNPVGIFNDGTGMVEPLGIPFLLLGVYLWPKNPIIAGLSLVVALMARGEYWIFSIGLVAAMIIFTRKIEIDKKIVLGLSFFVGLAVYMKYLINYTGNLIYPFYYNFLTNIYGTWQLKKTLEPADIQAKYIFLAIFIVSVVFSILVLWKRPNGMYLYLLGLGNWLFLGATFGLGAYIKSYMTYVWYVRFMILPYAFLGIILSIFLFYTIPNLKYGKMWDKIKFNWLIFLAVLGIAQLIWIPIWNKYSSTEPNWQGSVKLADQIASRYKGGGLLLFDGNPEITYALVKIHGVEGKDITGQMFDPYFYFEDDPYDDWGEKRKIVLKWIKKNNIRTIATYMQYIRYTKLVEKEPKFFYQDYVVPNSNIIIYKVKDDLFRAKI